MKGNTLRQVTQRQFVIICNLINFYTQQINTMLFFTGIHKNNGL